MMYFRNTAKVFFLLFNQHFWRNLWCSSPISLIWRHHFEALRIRVELSDVGSHSSLQNVYMKLSSTKKKSGGGGRRGRREGRMPLLHLKHSERWICCFSFSLLLTVNAYKGNFFSLRENILDLFFPKQFLTAAALFKREKTECHRLIKLFWWPPFTHSGPVLS